MIWLLAALSLASVACASDTRTYTWSSYQSDFYASVPRHAKADPQKVSARLEATLRRIIEKSQASGRKTPPGVLAEYGFLQLQRGDAGVAVGYFEQEAVAWPESAGFMEQMIARARGGAGS